MLLGRRSFIRTTASAAALAALSRSAPLQARGLTIDPLLDDLVERALAQARKEGASYADVRVVRRRVESLSAREHQLLDLSFAEDYGLGVRVIVDGAWGFAATPRMAAEPVARAVSAAVALARADAKSRKRPVTLAPNPVHVDVWQTPLTKDPFQIPIEQKAELLLGVNAEALKVKGVGFARSDYYAIAEWKLLATSEGCYVQQQLTRVAPRFELTAVDAKRGDFETLLHPIAPRQAGWEYIEQANVRADARKLGEQLLEKLAAPSVQPGKRELVLAPSNLWLTIHESIGHPTELDRALGYEANFAGTSFATPDKLGKLRIAAPHLTFYADKTTPGGLATCGYDDDGVKTQRWDLVKDGVFVGYQTTRDQAGWIGEPASRGTCYADSYASVPFQRMPNVSLAPGETPRTLEDLISGTEDGVLIIGDGTWSIDHQRFNFTFSGQLFWEIKAGKRTRMLRDVAYQANSIEFWNACERIGDRRGFRLGGAMYDGKGQPMQFNGVSHGCPPAYFRNIQLLNTSTRGA
ncbi:MAG TPA: TldD/PmbA family protein [Polyangiales bacterium]|nr:TldD/PmbA family protein [Polyangiales bacterium]